MRQFSMSMSGNVISMGCATQITRFKSLTPCDPDSHSNVAACAPSRGERGRPCGSTNCNVALHGTIDPAASHRPYIRDTKVAVWTEEWAVWTEES